MPIYQYKNEKTGEVSDKFMSIADMEQFEIDNPHMKKIIHAAAFAAPERMSCLLYTSPSPRDMRRSRMPSSA